MSRLRIPISCILLLGTFFFLQQRTSGERIPIRETLQAFPTTLGEWRIQKATILDEGTLDVLKPTDYLMRQYHNPRGETLTLYIGYWDTQRKGAQIHSPKNCLPGSGWQPVESSVQTISLPAQASSISVNRYLIQKDQNQELVFYWYQSRGRVNAGEVGARLEMISNAVFHNRSDGAIIRVSSPVFRSVSETTDSLVHYIQAVYPVLNQFLPD